MEKIINHDYLAIKTLIPYLRTVPSAVEYTKANAYRYQVIENVLWYILDQQGIDNAVGFWQDILARKVGSQRAFNALPNNAFTFGATTSPDTKSFGIGKFYNSVDYLTGETVSRSDLQTRKDIKAKVVQNFTDCSIPTLQSALKLLFNAEKVRVFETYPAGIDIFLIGSQLSVSGAGNRAVIKNLLPTGVSLGSLYRIFTTNYVPADNPYDNTTKVLINN